MRLFAVLFALIALGCSGCDQKVNPHIEWPPGADWDDYGQSHCSAQCGKLRELKCPEGQPTPGGITCEDSCEQLEEKHLWPKAALDCIVAAKSVDEVRVCNVRCGSL